MSFKKKHTAVLYFILPDIVHISLMQLQKGVVPIVHCFTKMPPPKCKKSQNEKEENKYQGQKLKKFDVN